MEYSDFLNGYLKSGGWRFGGKPSSTETFQGLYTPEAYNGGLLDQVGNPNKKGPVTAAVSAAPVSTAVTTGTLGGGGDRTDRTSGPHGNGTNLSDADWATVKDMRDAYGGFNNPFDRASIAQVGKFVVNPVGSIIDRVAAAIKGTPIKDPAIESLRDFQPFVNGQGRANFNLGVQANNALSSMGLPTSGVAFTPTPKSDVESIINDAIAAGGGGWSRSADSVARDAVAQAGGMGQSIAGDTSGMSSAYAKGGLVKGLIGPDPAGKDDGYAALDRGEYVVKASAVKKLGKKTLDNVNKGKLKKG